MTVSVLIVEAGIAEVVATVSHGHFGGDDIDIALLRDLQQVNECSWCCLHGGFAEDTTLLQILALFVFYSVVNLLADDEVRLSVVYALPPYHPFTFPRLSQELGRKTQREPVFDQRALGRLRTACERAKRTLSSLPQANIEIDELYKGMDFYSIITRERFEEINRDFFDECVRLGKAGLTDAGRFHSLPERHSVLLVGGSTRIPKVHQILKEGLDGIEVCTPSNRDEAVTYGAAIQGRILNETTTYGEAIQSRILPETKMEVLLLDATTLDLGCQVGDGEVTSSSVKTIVRRNFTWPYKRSVTFGGEGEGDVADDDVDAAAKKSKKGFFGKTNGGSFSGRNKSKKPQTGLQIRVFERRGVGFGCVSGSPWHLLGKFNLDGVTSTPVVPEIEVTFDGTGPNGCLKVTAVEKSTGNKNIVEVHKSHLSVEDIERMTNRVERTLAHRALFA